jgi:hypothetical protein
MKKLLVLFLALVPGAAFAAGVDVSWNACVGQPTAAQNKAFVCTGTQNQNYDLHFQYKTAQDIPNFVAITAYADIGPTGAPLSPFWHYENGGCNNAAIKGCQILGSLPAVCPDHLDTWDGGPSGTFAIAAYGADFQLPGRGHFILLGARGDAVPVTGGVNYWAFMLRFNNRNRTLCAGCAEQKVLVWQTGRLESNDGSPAVDLSGADKGSDCVQINGAPVGVCGATPVQSTNWGKIKSMYR